MFDARTFPGTLDDVKKILVDKGASYKGEYEIHDFIFSSKDSGQPLDKVFLRLRLIPVNIWNEKKVIVSIKSTEIKEIGKQSVIPLKEEFETESDARDFILKNYSDKFVFDFEFHRKGWQYDLGEDQVDLEVIEAYYSIEFKSKTEQGLKDLLDSFNVQPKEVICGPSVVVIRDILKTWRWIK